MWKIEYRLFSPIARLIPAINRSGPTVRPIGQTLADVAAIPTCNGKSLESRTPLRPDTSWTPDKLVDPRLDSKHESH